MKSTWWHDILHRHTEKRVLKPHYLAVRNLVPVAANRENDTGSYHIFFAYSIFWHDILHPHKEKRVLKQHYLAVFNLVPVAANRENDTGSYRFLPRGGGCLFVEGDQNFLG